MSSHDIVAYYFAVFAIILTHSTIVSVKGQCTIDGCENGDPSSSLEAEIQKLRVELFDQLNKQVQNIQDLLIASFQQMKSQHDTSIKNQSRNVWKLANGNCSLASDVCDCSDIKASGQTTSGAYEVCVGNQRDRVCTYAYCDMDTNNGKSLVFQRRKDGSVNFNRTWADYRQGFGNRNGEFWLGNEMLYLLTSKRNYKLRVDLEDFHGNKSFAEYTTFSISSSADNYRLTVSGYSGTAGESLNYNNGKQFSTNDADNGGNNCARRLGAGWWYTNCAYAHLNGIYGRYDTTVTVEMGFQWYYWHNRWQHPLKASEMKLVPLA